MMNRVWVGTIFSMGNTDVNPIETLIQYILPWLIKIRGG